MHWINRYPVDSVVRFVNSYPLDKELFTFFDINKRILKYISYLQSKEQSSSVIQSLVMSIDLHNNGKTSFYANLIILIMKV